MEILTLGIFDQMYKGDDDDDDDASVGVTAVKASMLKYLNPV